MTTCKPLVTAFKRVGITLGEEDSMSDATVLPATAQASAEVERLQSAYPELLTRGFEEDHALVKACKKEFDAAQSKSNTQAQLVDQKHITEAQIQAGKFKASTMAKFEKGEKLEQDRLKAL